MKRRVLRSGAVEEGEFSGLWLSRGKVTLPSGTVLEGTFRRGRLAEGKLTSSAGDLIEEGTFSGGRLRRGKRTWQEQGRCIVEEGAFDERGDLARGTRTLPSGAVEVWGLLH